MDEINALIAVESAEVGVREVGTSNTGHRVNQYHAAAGSSPGDPWCAALQVWSFREAGIDGWPHTAYTPDIEQWARGHNCLMRGQAKRGDVFLHSSTVDGEYRVSHTGLVVAASRGTVHTIEGNTDPAGGRQGIGVFALTRPIDKRIAFVRWSDVLSFGWRCVLGDGRSMPLRMLDGSTFVKVRQLGQGIGIDEAAVQALAKLPRARVIDDSTWAPVRACAEALGLVVTVKGMVVGLTHPA